MTMKENKRKCLKCGASPADDPETTLFRFPKPGSTNTYRCELWSKYCFPDKPWSSVEFQKKLYNEHRMLCHRHFKESSFVDFSLKKLRRFASPEEEAVNAPYLACVAVTSVLQQPTLHKSCPVMCCAVGCKSKRQDVRFFKIPKTETGMLWPKCEKLKHLRGLNAEQLNKYFICVKHFEKKCFAKYYKNNISKRPQLNEYAIPTLFTESEIINGYPDEWSALTALELLFCMKKINTKKLHSDHNYFKVRKCETQLMLDIMLSRNVTFSPNSPKLYDLLSNLLYEKFMLSRKQLFSRRASQALKFLKESGFERNILNIDLLTRKLILMEIKLRTKSASRQQFSDKEKLIALSIKKRSPKCYKFLQKVFILPSSSTFKGMVSQMSRRSTNSKFFEALKNEVEMWKEHERYCSILFAEQPLDETVNYDGQNYIIMNGFIQLENRTNEYADHALVFTLRGALSNWQRTVSFFFCKNSSTVSQLIKVIKELVFAVSNAGLVPLALVCDQSTAFQIALNSLQEETRKEHGQLFSDRVIDGVIFINGHIINIIYDPPYLIKGIRNHFLTKNIRQNNKISKWSDIVHVFTIDFKCNHTNRRLLQELNHDHVIPNKIRKNEVKDCDRVFNKNVAGLLFYTSNMSSYRNGNEVSSTLKNTAEILSFFDDLLNSVNGKRIFKSKCKSKLLRGAVTVASPHQNFWKEAIETLKNLKFIDNDEHEVFVASVKNWIITLESFQRLWQFFKSKNIKIMYPHYFNSDIDGEIIRLSTIS